MFVYCYFFDELLLFFLFIIMVCVIKEEMEKYLGYLFNYVFIQFYCDGNDYILEYSDKIIDVVKDLYIVNVSFGVQRMMVLCIKRKDKGFLVLELL